MPARHAAARRPTTRPTLVVVAVAAVLLLSLAGALVVTLTERLGNDVTRVPDAFKGLEAAGRPAAGDGLTFLLVGTDTRSDVPTTGTGADATAVSGRSDVLMVARLTEDGKAAAVVSIPRDSWVDIPGHGMNKINAAYAFGGPSLLIRTVENLTALRIDHFAVVDFAGFRSVVDAVDGIDVGISAATSNGGVDFHQGVNHLDGREALAYVRQRYGLTDGDLDRAQRQQNALRAVLTKMAATGILDDPVGLYRLLDAATSFVEVDDSLTNEGLRGLTQKVRAIPPENVSFLRAPVAGLGHQGAQSVVYLDTPQAGQLWDALRRGTMAGYAEQHADDTLGPVTR
jgi:LCP family protein required for cell wall assembly